MDERKKVRLQYMLHGMAYGFVFPFVSILVASRGQAPFGMAVLAGLVNALSAGPVMALLFTGLVPYTRRFPFLLAIVVQISAFFAAGTILLAVNIAIVVAVMGRFSIFDPEVYDRTRAILLDDQMKWIMASGVSLFFAIAIFWQIARKLGGVGIVWSWVTGKYHRPQEEERVFMFLDLKDSTPLAEALGPVRFSALIQEFFNDLGIAVFATRASVSHYIGDEAVIVWPVRTAFKKANCVRLFFKMRQEIDRRAEFYRSRFGLVPEFKAGVHMGPVVAAEVGRAKSEIVYHGDAVNTTARIVGLCSELGEDLLVSGEVARRLEAGAYVARSLGAQALKGKSETIEVFAVSPVASSAPVPAALRSG